MLKNRSANICIRYARMCSSMLFDSSVDCKKTPQFHTLSKELTEPDWLAGGQWGCCPLPRNPPCSWPFGHCFLPLWLLLTKSQIHNNLL